MVSLQLKNQMALNTELEVVEGMQFDRGYQSPYMVTDSDKMVAELERPYILVTDKNLFFPRYLTFTRTSGSI